MNITIDDTTALDRVATQLLSFAPDNRFFVFEGEMAAGKTTFIKAFCEAIGVRDLVSSPTFSIVNEYESDSGTVYHFDFYRLKNIQEAFDIGYEEYFYSDAYCLVEWPEKVTELLPATYVKVEISIIGDTKRVFTFSKVTS